MKENPLAMKLRTVADLNAEEVSALDALCKRVARIERRDDIISEGDRPEFVHLIVDGWAARYKLLPDGSRQILALLIPGDFCDLHVTVLREMDHGIVALPPCTVAHIDLKDLGIM